YERRFIHLLHDPRYLERVVLIPAEIKESIAHLALEKHPGSAVGKRLQEEDATEVIFFESKPAIYDAAVQLLFEVRLQRCGRKFPGRRCRFPVFISLFAAGCQQ